MSDHTFNSEGKFEEVKWRNEEDDCNKERIGVNLIMEEETDRQCS